MFIRSAGKGSGMKHKSEMIIGVMMLGVIGGAIVGGLQERRRNPQSDVDTMLNLVATPQSIAVGETRRISAIVRDRDGHIYEYIGHDLHSTQFTVVRSKSTGGGRLGLKSARWDYEVVQEFTARKPGRVVIRGVFTPHPVYHVHARRQLKAEVEIIVKQ